MLPVDTGTIRTWFK